MRSVKMQRHLPNTLPQVGTIGQSLVAEQGVVTYRSLALYYQPVTPNYHTYFPLLHLCVITTFRHVWSLWASALVGGVYWCMIWVWFSPAGEIDEVLFIRTSGVQILDWRYLLSRFQTCFLIHTAHGNQGVSVE